MKQELTFNEILELNTELKGISDQKTGEVLYRGLLLQKLPFPTKIKLNKLADTVKKEIEYLDGVRKELLEKYGVEKDGQYSIEPFLEELEAEVEEEKDSEEKAVDKVKKEKAPKKVPNPNLDKYYEELKPVLEASQEIEVPEFTIEDFKTEKHPRGFEADETYVVFGKLIKDNG